MNCESIVIFLLLGCGLLERSVHVQGRTSKELLITLSNGSKLKGRALQSHNGRAIKAFMGIPYAQPPIGDLRFQNPISAKPWKGVLDATKSSQICVQQNVLKIEGSEDCLYLNVYAPHLSDGKLIDLPVMVWFHGGAFHSGSGNEVFHAPDNLLDHDIVLVATNYRLGPLGFLSSGQEDCPGNLGLKDQVEVLKWVKKNIGSFGGDPKIVTAFGNSAGGASVTYLMQSPLAKGLFTRAISFSGTNLDEWAQPAHDDVAAKRAVKLAEILGCEKSNDWKRIIHCLRNATAENITMASQDFLQWDTDPMVPFPPVIEPDLPGAFITMHPRDDSEPHGIEIPFLTGITSDEGVIKSMRIFKRPELLKDFSKNYETALPFVLNYDHHSRAVQSQITNRVIKYYFNNEAPSAAKLENITNLFTDAWFLEGLDLYLRKRSAHPKSAPTFVYLLSHKGAASVSEIFGGDSEKYYGVCHGEELQYLFPLGQTFFHNSLPTKDDENIRKSFNELVVNFARTGNPTPSTSKLLPKWQQISQFPLNYYRIGNMNEDKPVCAMETGLYDDRARFWRKIGAHLPAIVSDKEEL